MAARDPVIQSWWSSLHGGINMVYGTQETTAMLFAYTNATLLLKWSKERSDV